MKALTWDNVLAAIRAAGPRAMTHQQIVEALGGHPFYSDICTLTRLMVNAGEVSVWRFTGAPAGDLFYAKEAAWAHRLFDPATTAVRLGPTADPGDDGSVNDVLRHAVRHGAPTEE